MRPRGIAVAALVLVFAGILVWRTNHPRADAAGISAAGTPVARDSVGQAGPEVSPSKLAALPSAALERSTLADQLNSPNQDIHADLRILDEVFTTFRSNFSKQGNPTGNNAEITSVLTGKNSLGLAVIPRDHPAINAKGELCDRWGHPFFFHQLSGIKMEIRSAGPDQKFWTADDVVYTP